MTTKSSSATSSSQKSRWNVNSSGASNNRSATTTATGSLWHENKNSKNSVLSSSSTRMSSACVPLFCNSRQEDPWIHRHFLKDSKLRVRERYWRPLTAASSSASSTTSSSRIQTLLPFHGSHSSSTSSNRCSLLCLADALTWRKYLPLIQKMTTTMMKSGSTSVAAAAAAPAGDISNDSTSTTPTTLDLEFVLLESAAELLDHRNQAGEASTTSQERAILIRLVQQQKIHVFADLSVRECPDGAEGDDEDEWDWLDYNNLTVDERCRHALVRAGRMIRARDVPSLSTSTSGEDHHHHPVYLVVSDEESVRYFQGVTLDEGLAITNMKDLLELYCAASCASNDTNKNKVQTNLEQIFQACEEEYERRNDLSKSTTTTRGNSSDETVCLSSEQIQMGLRDGTLLRGRLEVSKDNPREAFVTVASKQRGTYLVQKQRGHFQQAFHHDIVILQVLPKEEWGRSTPRLVHHRDTAEDDDDANEDRLDVSVPPIPSARVVAIEKPSRRTFVATLLDLPKETDSNILVVPMDVRIPKIRVNAKSFPNYVNQRLLIQVDNWEAGSSFPQGRCLQVLGPIGDLETEVKALLLENQVALDPFSTAALACLPSQGPNWKIPLAQEIEQNHRRDLRTSRMVFSVDPPGCQDIDDSMHAHQLPNGDIEVGVHIADVTYFVPHNSALDLEAQVRGTTFYLVDRRFDMLPALLSSNLCSLHGQTDRLAVSAIWTLSSDFQQVKSCWFGRTIIHNCAAMTYEQADNILQGKQPDDPNSMPPPPLTAGGPVNPSLIGKLRIALTVLTKLARKLRQDREEVGGAVDLSSGDLGNELKFTLDEKGNPTKVVPKADKEIHHTIAELMILANTSVADKIYKSMPESALLRVHRTVEEDRFGDLREILEAYGISLQGSSNMALAETLKQASHKRNSIVDALLKSFATRAMSEAQYICTGDIDQVDELSHYGLGLKTYTHFTSPIRRYADVVVHKQLLAALRLEQELMSEKQHPTSGPIQRAQLSSLPESNVVSILSGEGLSTSREPDIDLLDALIEGASELVLGSNSVEEAQAINNSEILLGQESPLMTQKESTKPYPGIQVSQICEGLNLHNRLAKYSSTECQKLFLSLYFRDHVEVTQGVVVKLRANGFWCYVPKFDLRVPVYLKDMFEQVQIDPRLLGLPLDAGLPCTKGFSSSFCRLLPHAKCELSTGQQPADHSMDQYQQLEVSSPGAPRRLILCPLQVVTIHLACENFDLRARVPAPRAHLLASSSLPTTATTAAMAASSSLTVDDDRRVSGAITSSDLKTARRNPVQDGVRDLTNKGRVKDADAETVDASLFRILSSLLVAMRRSDTNETARGERRTSGKVAAVPATNGPVISNSKASVEGRMIFGRFVNPDTRLAMQEALQQNAAAEAAERRAKIAASHASRQTEYNTTSRIERATTSRQQRLAAEKRNTRRSKAK